MSRIVTAVVAVSAIGGLLALFSIDSTRAVIVNVRASLGGGAPVQFGAAESEPAQASAQLPPRVAAPAAPEPAAALPDPSAARRHLRHDGHNGQRVGIGIAVTRRNYRRLSERGQGQGRRARAGGARSRPRGRPGCAGRPRDRTATPARAVPARRIDPDELAALLKRAKGLLAIGDITSARLLLERAADAQEPEAALMLAGTYDPQVLGSQDMRSVTPDPAAARVWYQKAAQLGSADAKRRLGQLQN